MNYDALLYSLPQSLIQTIIPLCSFNRLNITNIRLKLSHLKKKLSCRQESNPGPTALATSAQPLSYDNPRLPRPSHFPFILLSSTICCSIVLNRPPIMCHQNTFSVALIGGLLSMRLQQTVLLNSIKVKCESLGSRGLS